jgi:hypothetical protein
MNERIEKLAELCGFRPSPSIYDRNQSFDIEKFAELIVKECADVAADHEALDIYEEIREHFGVEE